MKIFVLGAGAVGSTVGGMLARAGHEVTLIGRDPHMLRIASSGLRIKGIWGDHLVSGVKAVTKLPAGTPDWVLLTTKAFDTEAAAKLLAERFPGHTPVLHLQNGIGNAELLAGELGWPRVFSAMIIIGFRVTMAGYTAVTVSADKIRIGGKDGAVDGPVQEIVDIFNQAGMPAAAAANVHQLLWEKALYSSALNPLASILGVNYGELLEPSSWAMIERILQEAFAVLKAEGQSVSWATAQDYGEYLRTYQVPATFDHKPSMLSDLNHGRRTEVDFINGAWAALGRQHGIPTPVNDTLIRMIHAFEANTLKRLMHQSQVEAQ